MQKGEQMISVMWMSNVQTAEETWILARKETSDKKLQVVEGLYWDTNLEMNAMYTLNWEITRLGHQLLISPQLMKINK